jgi:hypothetical protein
VCVTTPLSHVSNKKMRKNDLKAIIYQKSLYRSLNQKKILIIFFVELLLLWAPNQNIYLIFFYLYFLARFVNYYTVY